jgi:hypothetical protein
MKVGRPPKYKTVKDLQKAIDTYFDEVLKVKNDNGEVEYVDHPTITGLALHLGFESRQSLYDYKGKEEFSYTIKRAITRIESVHERNLLNNGSTGSIFWLKNRGWTDKQYLDHTSDGEPLNTNDIQIIVTGERPEITDT